MMLQKLLEEMFVEKSRHGETHVRWPSSLLPSPMNCQKRACIQLAATHNEDCTKREFLAPSHSFQCKLFLAARRMCKYYDGRKTERKDP